MAFSAKTQLEQHCSAAKALMGNILCLWNIPDLVDSYENDTFCPHIFVNSDRNFNQEDL